ncbi:hypothetical protein [Actinoplanes sp. NBRC 103695]|uniref:hypothetical protein n=1 Tax=Actinoplanes sp. NBRC 103695 TaxID=3032202 RepID=UPI0025549D2A|nr:hypothetical protein [Actinoplanes sp. NBRC 103695]
MDWIDWLVLSNLLAVSAIICDCASVWATPDVTPLSRLGHLTARPARPSWTATEPGTSMRNSQVNPSGRAVGGTPELLIDAFRSPTVAPAGQ